MSGFQAPITIYQAIERINKNEFLLPAFQREFVWKPEQIEKLFDSLMQGYPISSMLFWKVKGTTKSDFNFYKFLTKFIETHATHNDIISTNGVNDFHAILDGQQRLTALYIGLCGSYAYKKPYRQKEYNENNYPTRHLYFNISSTYSDHESDRKYKFSFLEDKADTNENPIHIDANNEKWFKAGMILDLHENDGLDEFAELHKIIGDEKKRMRQFERVIYDGRHINFYEEDEQNPDKAVNIFVRINSGGTPLSLADILMSITIASWKTDARTEITKLVDTVRAKGFSIDESFVLRAFLFLYHKDVRFQITSFNNEFVANIEKNWGNISTAILSLFDLIKTFGLDDHTLTTNNATLPILYYIYHKNVFSNFSDKKHEEDREIIRKWLFAILLRRTFGGQTDTVLNQSRKAFTSDVNAHKFENIPVLFPASEINTDIKKLTDIGDDFIAELLLTQYGSQYSFTILALLYPDFRYDLKEFAQDHLHPQKSYDKDLHDWKIYNSILNLQMLDKSENSSKSDAELDVWVSQKVAEQDRKEFLDSHLIPGVSLKLEDFDEFITARTAILTAKLKSILS
ncbi:MAG: DUF262 domain-containing protein [Methylococcaceae bacterium]